MHIRTVLTAAVGLWLLTLPFAADSYAQDPALPDTLTIDSVVAFTGGIGAVPIHFVNDENLAGMEVTIAVESPDIQIDSFSFVDSRIAYISVKGTYSLSGAISAYCFPFSAEPLISPGSGLFGTLYLSWDPSITPQVVPIDTVTVVVGGDTRYATTFADEFSTPFTPQIRPGWIDIQQSFGCCLNYRGNVDNDAEDKVNVADISALVDYLFKGSAPPDCMDEADVDGSGGTLNVADITYLVEFLFKGGPQPPDCQ